MWGWIPHNTQFLGKCGYVALFDLLRALARFISLLVSVAEAISLLPPGKSTLVTIPMGSGKLTVLPCIGAN